MRSERRDEEAIPRLGRVCGLRRRRGSVVEEEAKKETGAGERWRREMEGVGVRSLASQIGSRMNLRVFFFFVSH
jgi:hypothetical protein